MVWEAADHERAGLMLPGIKEQLVGPPQHLAMRSFHRMNDLCNPLIFLTFERRHTLVPGSYPIECVTDTDDTILRWQPTSLATGRLHPVMFVSYEPMLAPPCSISYVFHGSCN